MNAFARIFRQTDTLVGLGLLVVVTMLVVPLPDFVLDAALIVLMASSFVIVLTAVNVKDPLEFSVFPSLLLLQTVFRLALSIAATKLILGHGHAGQVIRTFGEFVLGGNIVVGFVSFLILMIVQFIVITNGATRVSEVVARFTLDAMPGKQMAIDADLAAGLIDEEDARRRRKHVKQEADFYGAMDGASKFVKGDAIAAVLIIAVNIVGGFAMGFMRGDGDVGTVLSTYAMLSVGEGLVTQIPALLVSTASGLLVTRSGQETGMGTAIVRQVAGQPRALVSTGVALAVLGFLPGFPTLLFLALGGGVALLGRAASKAAAHPAVPAAKAKPDAQASQGDAIMPLVSVDPLEIEIGYGLTRLADARAGGDLPQRVAATRRQTALDLGFVMPGVRIRDNATMESCSYAIKVRGETVAEGRAEPNMLLAIGRPANPELVPGLATTEPVFGLEAVWIDPQMRDQAERNGLTVVEPGAMVATHLAEVVRAHAAELLTRQDVADLLENAKSVDEAAVKDAVPAILSLGDLQKVLQHLLRERIPIRDFSTILETAADFAPKVSDPDQLGELVRAALGRTVTRQYLDAGRKLVCLTLDPALERSIQESLQQSAGGSILALEPSVVNHLVRDVEEAVEQAKAEGKSPVLLASVSIRLPLKRLLERHMPRLPVLAYNEVSSNAEVEIIGQVGAAAMAA
jgi:flagellar biosynthesis protein FlhA